MAGPAGAGDAPTTETPLPGAPKSPEGSGGSHPPDGEVTQTVPAPGAGQDDQGGRRGEGGQGGPDGRRAQGPDAEETTVLPPVPPASQDQPRGAAEETTVLPPVRPAADDRRGGGGGSGGGAGSGGGRTEGRARTEDRPADPADRVPPWLFRAEDEEQGRRPASEGEAERTRELPQVPPPAEDRPQRRTPGRGRRRSDWAEETPLDDLPTLSDELFGPQSDEDNDGRGGSQGGRRG
ncbi:MAG TPA: hypothetical protein DEQ61_11355 [Streptomyces sp.]|nr:hypothetical protein [Streptomyces sp.]